jgi:hypothetical protein
VVVGDRWETGSASRRSLDGLRRCHEASSVRTIQAAVSFQGDSP